MRPPLPHWAPALGDADLHSCPLSPLEQFEVLPLDAPPALNRGELTEPETEANRSCQQQWLLSFALPPGRVLPNLRTPLSRKTKSCPHKWIPFGCSQAKAAAHFALFTCQEFIGAHKTNFYS